MGCFLLDFYEISKDYLDYLRGIDGKVPESSSTKNAKFYCGVVLEINSFEYFVPVSSFTERQSTNLLIIDNEKKTLSSLRFCFMVPIPPGKRDEIVQRKDFSLITDTAYVGLLSKEHRFCQQNEERIKNKAVTVYKMGIDPKHPRHNDCCKFEKLETSCSNFFVLPTKEN